VGPDRLDHILKYADLSRKGLEIAPYFNPAVPKAAGHHVLVLDVFDTARRKEGWQHDPMIPRDRLAEIEEVDIVGDACSLGELMRDRGLLGELHYIVSSHNFEHLPHPILFLQCCATALAPGGVVSMAVPDCRACYDHFRMPTALSSWLDAYHDGRGKPAPGSIFDARYVRAYYQRADGPTTGCSLGEDPLDAFVPERQLAHLYTRYLERRGAEYDYKDCHCSVFFPPSLELMLRDLLYLGLIDLEVVEISDTIGHEFFVHLRKPFKKNEVSDDAFYAQRDALLTAVAKGMGRSGVRQRGRGLRSVKRTLAALVGPRTYARVRGWNSARRKRRHEQARGKA
jgi:hypothetical protein